jgi:hypothetical protein
MLCLLVASCDERLDIKTDFPFELEVMPVSSQLENGQTAEILCHIKREGQYAGSSYKLRYFQYDGTGDLLYDKKIIKPNRLYPLFHDTIRLFYYAKSKDSHEFQIWVSDNFGNEKTAEFSFN